MSERFRLLLLVVVAVYLFMAVWLIRRKRLSLNYSLLWLLMLAVLLVMVLFPQVVYGLAGLLKIGLPINLLITGFAFFALLMLFYLTCIVSRDNEKNRVLTQQLALLENRVRELEEQLDRLASQEQGGDERAQSR